MSLTSLSIGLHFVLLIATCLAAFKLLKNKLYRRYPVFFAYLLYRIPYGICELLLDVASTTYFYFWKYTLILTLIFYLLTIRELYSLVLERHRGIYTLGRWVLYLDIAVSVGLSVLSMLPKFGGAAGQSRTVTFLLIVQRNVTLSLALFIVLMLFLLSPYATVLTRNVMVHAVIFAVFYITTCVGRLLQYQVGREAYAIADVVLAGIYVACTFTWFRLLTPTGEKAPPAPPTLGPKQEGHLLLQLDKLNETLLKAGKQ